MKRNLIIISAPSGTGKSTICREIQYRRPDWDFSLSCTTRPKRSYEKDGFDYLFLTEEEFKKKIDNGELFEYEEVHGYLYGTPNNSIENAIINGDMLLLEVDVKGGLAFQNSFKENTLSIFIKPPNREELVKRLLHRGSDSDDQIEKRLERMDLELSYEDRYDYTVINNTLKETVDQIIHIVENQKEELQHVN
ncbi:MAG: guanylate kinase [Candidatus Marinimicrobia bacterium]|nr:guanylate kinase [Candidatus Neomarinimicrobiota bacterium]